MNETLRREEVTIKLLHNLRSTRYGRREVKQSRREHANRIRPVLSGPVSTMSSSHFSTPLNRLGSWPSVVQIALLQAHTSLPSDDHLPAAVPTTLYSLGRYETHLAIRNVHVQSLISLSSKYPMFVQVEQTDVPDLFVLPGILSLLSES
jgi:hypothetical protein